MKRFKAKSRCVWVSRDSADDRHCGNLWSAPPGRSGHLWRVGPRGGFLAGLDFDTCAVTKRLFPSTPPGTTRRVEIVTAHPGFLKAVRALAKEMESPGDSTMDTDEFNAWMERIWAAKKKVEEML